MFNTLLITLSLLLPLTLSVPASSNPRVKTKFGTFIGKNEDSDLGKQYSVDTFYNIRYGKAPVGDLRFASPVKDDNDYGVFDSTSHGYNCPQSNLANGALNLPPAIGNIVASALDKLESIPAFSPIIAHNASEDCLNLMVARPGGLAADSKLPVVVWFFPGAFLFGGISMYSGKSLIPRSVEMNQSIIFVAPNTRINSFGYLPGQEVQNDPSTDPNAGLKDQRLALEWVRDNIADFGGDPNRVTLFGESSGAIGIGMQMIAKDGDTEGLFHAAFMSSGAPINQEGPSRGQPLFDTISNAAGCSKSTNKIACLRALPYEDMLKATNAVGGVASYSSLGNNYSPRTDGTFLTDQAHKLLEQGKYAKIPVMTGNQWDEGSVFGFGILNLTTSKHVDDYLHLNLFPNTTNAQRAEILRLYPQDITQGCPFDSGIANALTPQSKRMNAILGDAVFHSARRSFLSVIRKTQPTWTYASRVLRGIPILGTFHASDLLNIYGLSPAAPTSEIQTRFIAFANSHNPNFEGYQDWPNSKDDVAEGTSTLLEWNEVETKLASDTYRAEQLAFWPTIVASLAQ